MHILYIMHICHIRHIPHTITYWKMLHFIHMLHILHIQLTIYIYIVIFILHLISWTLFVFFSQTTTRVTLSSTPYTAQRPHAYLLVPVCAQKIEEIQSPGLCVYPPTRDIQRGFSAQNGQYLVLQTFSAFQTLYKDRRWHAVPWVCLCFFAGAWKSTRVRRNQVILCIICIFFVFLL